MAIVEMATPASAARVIRVKAEKDFLQCDFMFLISSYVVPSSASEARGTRMRCGYKRIIPKPEALNLKRFALQALALTRLQ
jgi:hypothetical protein